MSKLRDKSKLSETRKFYDEHSFDVPDFAKDWMEKRLKRLNIKFPEKGKILDVGAGSGRTSFAIKRINPKLDVFCLDISGKSLKRLPFKKVNASSLEIPFKDNTFDLVVSIGCLHHTPDAYKGFKECVRVLKKGKPFVVSLYNSWNLYPIIYHITKHFRWLPIKSPIIQDQFFNPVATFHSIKKVKRWFRKNNIKLVSVMGIGYSPPWFLKKFSQYIFYYGIKF